MSDDDVIHHFDLEDLCGFEKPFRHAHVGFGWVRFTARMIVQANDGKRRTYDRDAENITGMDVAFI